MLKKQVIINVGLLPPPLLKELQHRYEVREYDKPGNVDQITGLVTSAISGVSPSLIESLPALQVISSFGVGTDRIALDAAHQRGIAVGNTPKVLNDCVADLAVGLMIGVARNFSSANNFVRSGAWIDQPKFPVLGHKISGKRLGIVGMGRIGRIVAKRMSGFDMDIRYFERAELAEVPWRFMSKLVELARWADFLVVCASGGESSRNLINREVLEALGPAGYLVNISRGSIVDEAALIQALQGNLIAGAALDVYQEEPVVPAALLACANTILLPHIASSTHETREAMSQLVLDNLRSFYEEGKLIAQVRPVNA